VPALPNVPNTVRCALNGLIDGTKPWVNLFHLGWSVGGTITSSEVLALATAIVSSWGTDMAPAVSDTLQLAEVIVTALDSSTAPVGIVASGATGALTTQPLNAGTAMVIQRKVARRFRGGHSRVYLPGMVASYLDDTETSWDAANLAAIAEIWADIEQEAVVNLVSAGFTDAFALSISYFDGFTNVLYPSGRYHVKPTPRVTPLRDGVTEWVGNPRPCSQRRRQQP
jgi:hypothetical protein